MNNETNNDYQSNFFEKKLEMQEHTELYSVYTNSHC